MGVYEMSPGEIYDAYAPDIPVEDFAQLERDEIAGRLMNEEGLDQDSAYYAADQMLEYAQTRLGPY